MFKGSACFFMFDFYWQYLFYQGTTLSNIWHFLRKKLNFKSKKILRNFNMWEYVVSIWNICSNRTVLNNKIYQKKSSVNIFNSRNEYKEKQVKVFFLEINIPMHIGAWNPACMHPNRSHWPVTISHVLLLHTPHFFKQPSP